MSHTRRQFVHNSLVAGISLVALGRSRGASARDGGKPGAAYDVSRDVPTKYFDGDHCWCHPRAGIVPGAGSDGAPRVVLTMNTMDLSGSDVFRAVHGMKTDDLGAHWTEPQELDAMRPRYETIDGQRRPVAASDFWPAWHAASKTLLGTGHSVVYTPQWRVVPKRPRHTVYAAYDAQANRWAAWRKLEMPDEPRYINSGAGCTQRVDVPDGSILLPFYFKPPDKNSRVAVMRCTFDGDTLKFVEQGNVLAVEDDTRGIGEPSLARFDGGYYLTIRHDRRGYVTRSHDGLHFEPLKPWTFDDDSDLGSYNTQQHWATHSDGLYLVYTRRGLDNDHVFRNRAPLVMAQVDPVSLRVVRGTEQVLVPERGARLGNFGVTNVNPDETWVTVAEWMQPRGCEKYGSDGSMYVARVRWTRPNLLAG